MKNRIPVGALQVFVMMCVLTGALHVFAQRSGSPAGREDKLQVVHVQGNVYLIAGAGGNVVAQVGDETVMLVDSGLPEYSDQIRAAVSQITKRPIGFIVNTTIDRDHIAGNEALAKGGVFMLTSANQQRSQAAILAHLNLLTRLTHSDGKLLGMSDAGFPTDTFDNDIWRL